MAFLGGGEWRGPSARHSAFLPGAGPKATDNSCQLGSRGLAKNYPFQKIHKIRLNSEYSECVEKMNHLNDELQKKNRRKKEKK
jgi:hypothetical protein